MPIDNGFFGVVGIYPNGDRVGCGFVPRELAINTSVISFAKADTLVEKDAVGCVGLLV